MIELNLKAETQEYKLLKEYLENNVSEVLADKINNGVKIIKDNKTLINKKDLTTFENYAYQEASKLRKNNQRMLAVHHNTVFEWAIHYFEEDSIEGKLYNEDGTEYQPPKPKVENKTPKYTPPAPKKPENKQSTLFDLFDTPKQENNEQEETLSYKAQLAKSPQPDPLDDMLQHLGDEEEIVEPEDNIESDDDWTEEEMDEALQEIDKEIEQEKQVINKETGEVLKPTTNEIQSIDKEYAIMLSCLFDGKMEAK